MTVTSGRVLVAGATGGTGRRVLDVLRETDGEFVVRAATRSSAEADALRERGADEVVVCDVMDPADAARAVEDADAVICTVGSSLGRSALTRDVVDGTGTITLVDAAAEAGVRHFVSVSAIGVGDSAPGMPLPFRLLLRGLGVLPAKARAESRLRDSSIPYTILRPGGLTNAPATHDVAVGEGGNTVSGSIPRADVARLAVSSLFTPAAANRTLEVVARERLRDTPDGLVSVPWRSAPDAGGDGATAEGGETTDRASGSVAGDTARER